VAKFSLSRCGQTGHAQQVTLWVTSGWHEGPRPHSYLAIGTHGCSHIYILYYRAFEETTIRPVQPESAMFSTSSLKIRRRHTQHEIRRHGHAAVPTHTCTTHTYSVTWCGLSPSISPRLSRDSLENQEFYEVVVINLLSTTADGS
jgi:hypothetical protein